LADVGRFGPRNFEAMNDRDANSTTSTIMQRIGR